MENRANDSYFSSICIERCKGACCDPWWGIISYTMVKEGGLKNLSSFRAEVLKGIKVREERILEGYSTSERPPRRLFKSPQRYNVSVRDIRVSGSTLNINILAMYAFRCLFISEDKKCMIHPSVLCGDDIRPPHCGFMGTLEARPGEKGYCRIIHAAEGRDGDLSKVDRAIETEKGASLKHFEAGVDTAEEAADRVVGAVKSYCERNAPNLLPGEAAQAPGRNDPCPCGSGKKFKKCHGA